MRTVCRHNRQVPWRYVADSKIWMQTHSCPTCHNSAGGLIFHFCTRNLYRIAHSWFARCSFDIITVYWHPKINLHEFSTNPVFQKSEILHFESCDVIFFEGNIRYYSILAFYLLGILSITGTVDTGCSFPIGRVHLQKELSDFEYSGTWLLSFRTTPTLNL